MADDRWQEVKSKVEGLGLKLKLHLEQEHEAAGEGVNSAVNDAKAALEEMGAKLQDAIDSLGNAAKDPAIRADVKDLGSLLRDAMNETLSTVGDEVNQILKKTKGEMTDVAEAAEDAVTEVAEVVDVEESNEPEG